MSTYPWSSALVTGASSGIGEAMVRRLAAAGVPTVAVARRRDRLDALAAELPGVEVLVADLVSHEGIAAVEERLRDRERPVELLVNNAGFGTSGPMVETDPGRLVEQVELNVVALVRLARAAAEVMVERRRGWICNVSSVAGFQAAPDLATYAATKAFVTSFSEGIALELKRHGVKVSALCPGLTRTEFQQVSNPGGRDLAIPGVRYMSADEVACVGLADMARGRVISVPGAAYRALVAVSDVTPRALGRQIAGLVARRR